MATDPTTSPFYRAANSRVEDTRPVDPPQDFIQLLKATALRPAEPVEADIIEGEYIDLDPVDMEGIVDVEVEEVPFTSEFPIAEASFDSPAEESLTAMEAIGDEPDLSSVAPSVLDLQRAMRPVDIEELRRMVDAGTIGNANTDPYGQRLRTTIRQLVRGL